MNVLCSAKPCPVLLSSTCVFYEGEDLIFSGINTNDTVQLALQKLDAAIGNDVFTVNVTSPLTITAGPNPIIGITQASATVNGYLTSTDWNIFNNKQNAVSLTTTGSSGPATFNGTTGALNIPDYSGAFSGFVPTTRTLTINGVGQDLSADRTWTIDTLYTADGSLTSNRTVTMGSNTLSFEKDVTISGLTVGKGNGAVITNTAIGYSALASNISGGFNVAIGRDSLYSHQSGNSNTAVGHSSLYSNLTGGTNIAIGTNALYNNTSSSNNTAIGSSSLYSTTSSGNVAVGGNSLLSNNSGTNNTAIGLNAGYGTGPNANTTGSNNIFIGRQSIGVSATESNRTWIGNSSTTSTWLGGNLLLGSTTNTGLAKLQVTGAIQQSSVISSMLKANSNGVLVNAVANTDYLPVNNPVATGQFQLLGPGITTYTAYTDTLGAFVADVNSFQLLYVQNINSGSDASADVVAYNDASDVNSFFIDMGINSSNYSSVLYPIFTANSGYLFTGGGSTGVQPSNLYIGTSTPTSDVILFAGGVDVADAVITVKAATKNVVIGTGVASDTGEKVQIAGNVKVDSGDIRVSGGGVYADLDMLGDPHQLTTKEYVDNQVSAGLHVHQPVRVETNFAFTATYTQGGTTPTITDITLNEVLTSVGHGLAVDDMIVFNTTSNGITAGLSYFVYQVLSPDTFTISETLAGPEINTLVNGTGLTLTSRANSGVGATLTNAGAQVALVVDGITLVATDRILIRDQAVGYWNGVYVVNDPGSPTTNWVLERATDANRYGFQSPNALGGGDYFYVLEGLIGIGESYVITNVGDFIIGTDTIVFTLFSASPAYYGTDPISVVGQNVQLTGIVDALHGGTGTGTVTTGDILYGSASNVWSKLPLGVAYKSLIVNGSGTNVEWNAIPLNQSAAVSGQLGVVHGGTGAATLTGVLIGNGTSAFTDVTGTALQLLRRNSTNTAYEFFTPSYITLAALSATSPLLYNNATGVFSIQVANASQDGYLSSTDWSTFNGKQNTITLTTTGSSGSSTFISNTLNVPTYTLSGLGGVPTSRTLTINGTSYDLSADRSWSVGTVTSVATSGPITGGTITGSGTIGITQSSSSTDGYLSSTDWNTFNGKQAQINGTGFVKASGTTISYDNSTYYLASNPSGFVNYNIYTNDGTLASDRTMDANGKFLKFDDSNGIQIITTPHTNNAIYIEAAEPNINLKAMGATNGAAVFFSPSNASYYGALHNRTGGGLEFYVGAAGAGSTPTVGLVLEATKQLKLNAYTSTSSFPGTASAYLAVNTSGEVITVTGGGGGGGGTVTSVATSGPITGGTITTSGTIGITQATTSTDGYLSSTDWNTFNGKINYNIYTQNGTLTGNRTVLTTSGYTLTLNPQTTALTTLTASGSASSYAILGQNTVSYGAGFSSGGLGYTYGATGGISLQTFAGNATFDSANLVAGHVSVNSINFSSVGSNLITMTQSTSPGVRAMAAHIAQLQYTRAQSGTISHLAIQQNLGIYMPAGSGTLTVTNAYSFLINPLTDYGVAGLTLTNRWGIYQAGTDDDNYFGSKVLIGVALTAGIPNDAGAYNLQVGGQIRLNSYTSTSSYTGTLAGYLGFTASGDIITVASSSGGNTIYTGDGTLSGARIVSNGGNTLSFESTVANSIPLQATGTAGTLFKVTDNSTGNILQVNNASGSQIYAIDVTGTVYQASPTYTFAGINTTTTLVTLPSSSSSSLFIEYYANNTSNGGYRAGMMIVVDNGSAAEYTEYRTVDLTATTSGLVLSASISGSDVLVTGTITSGTWNIKLAVRAL